MVGFDTHVAEFPQQRVGAATKNKASWYANCIDYVIHMGLNLNDRSDTEIKLNILHGDIPDTFYKKTLNPYNSSNERFLRFPSTMRNLDIMTDIVRRYVSEYHKSVHDFTAIASSPELVLKRKAKLQQEVMGLCMQAFQQQVEQNIQQLQQQAIQQGQDPNQIDQQQAIPDMEEFVKNFNENYIDKETKQAQDVLDFVRSITEDDLIYLGSFFDFCTLGECYTYTDIRGEDISKERVPVIEAYPIPNEKFFIEDHDMFARKMLMSYSQIMDMFDDTLSKQDKEFLDKYYNDRTPYSTRTKLLYSQYFEYYPDVCEKFTKEERDLFRRDPIDIGAENGNLFEVWHVVWRGEAKRGIVKYVSPIGLESEKIVEEGYKLNPEEGDISIDWVYEPQVYEGYRIGSRYNAIYPIKARPINYQRNGKLPYNGIMEVLPFMGKFSIISLVTPYQILRNIISYHREMVIAKNKMLVLLIPESLIASDTEDKIYKMAADSVLIVDDEQDSNSQKMAQIRMLNANLGDYITQLTNLMEAIKLEAREMVDMNVQRYGEIAQSAGASVTQEAIARSSMGSVIITTVFDLLRCKDYQRDLDYCKFAYVEGLQRTFLDSQYNQRYLSLDVNSYISADYGVYAKNSQKELEKLQQLKQWAFSAAQNGDLDMAIAAITGDNVAQIKDLVNKFMEIKRQHEEALKQADAQLEQQKLQNEITKIQVKGEEDRKTKLLELGYQTQFKSADLAMAQANQPINNEADKLALQQQAEQNKQQAEQNRLQLDREKLNADMYSKAADRQVKREQMANDLKIARTNKNKYDK